MSVPKLSTYVVAAFSKYQRDLKNDSREAQIPEVCFDEGSLRNSIDELSLSQLIKFNNCINNTNPLIEAMRNNHKDIVKWLLNYNKDMVNKKINEKDETGKTALHYASEYGCREVVEMLLNRGADVNIHDDGGQTSLHWASINGYYEILRCCWSMKRM